MNIRDDTFELTRIATMLLLCSFPIISCDHPVPPDTGDNVVFTGGNSYSILSFDSYAGDQLVKLYWHIGFVYDFPLPLVPRVDEVRLYISSTGPDSEFHELGRFAVGEDSTIAGELTNGSIYYFRLTTHDSAGTQIGLSRPLMTSPGIPRQPIVSVTASFGDSPLYMTSIAWAPDGQRIAYVRSMDLLQNVYVLQLSDLTTTQVTNYSGDNHRLMSLDWDSTGQRIAYCYTPSRTFGEIDYRIWLISLQGGSPNAVTSGRVDADPSWESSSRLVFCRGTYEPPNIPELWQVDLPAGNTESALTTDQLTRKYTPSVCASRGLIVFSGEAAVPPYTRYLFTVPVSGGLPEALTPNTYWQDLHPSWSSDAQTVYFTSSRSGHYEIWALHFDTGAFNQITQSQQKGHQRFYGRESPDGTKLALIEMGENPSTAMLHVQSSH